MVTGQHRPRRTDSNGVPKPVVKWYSHNEVTVAKCRTCLWSAEHADLALARIHVKTYPDHMVALRRIAVTEVWAQTTDGVDWVEAVNAL